MGCLLVLLVGGAMAWFARDLWWEAATGRAPGAALVWVAPDSTVDPRSRLGREAAASYVSLSASDLATILSRSTRGIIDSPEVAIAGPELHLRGKLLVGSLEGIGPLAGWLPGAPRLELAGRPALRRRGQVCVTATDLRVGGVQVPSAAREALVARWGGAAENRDCPISFSVPNWVGDLRVANGKLTVYKDRP